MFQLEITNENKTPNNNKQPYSALILGINENSFRPTAQVQEFSQQYWMWKIQSSRESLTEWWK
jgi:hypothetical protein